MPLITILYIFGIAFAVLSLSQYCGWVSSQRVMPGGWVDRGRLPKGTNGRVLCRWCSLEVPSGRYTFCSEFCVEEWKMRSDPGHLRARVFERDHGICAHCGIDCVAEEQRIRRLRGVSRVRAKGEWRPGARKSLWDADHVTPVVEGGGECDLSNMQTLCLKCHRARTAELRDRLSGRGRDNQTISGHGQEDR
jgi:5-methylcytosine-specific restriction enzyme A